MSVGVCLSLFVCCFVGQEKLGTHSHTIPLKFYTSVPLLSYVPVHSSTTPTCLCVRVCAGICGEVAAMCGHIFTSSCVCACFYVYLHVHMKVCVHACVYECFLLHPHY